MGSDVSRKELRSEEGSLNLNCRLILVTTVVGEAGEVPTRGEEGAPIYSTKFSRILHEN